MNKEFSKRDITQLIKSADFYLLALDRLLTRGNSQVRFLDITEYPVRLRFKPMNSDVKANKEAFPISSFLVFRNFSASLESVLFFTKHQVLSHDQAS